MTPARFLWPAIEILPRPPQPFDGETLEELLLASLDETGLSAWQEHGAGWRAFFSTAEARDRALARLRADAPSPVDATAIDVPDEDWAARSQANLTAVRVGRIVLTPPWAAGTAPGTAGSTSPDPATIEIVIQPSMGFGTGHHASTRLCTALLQQIPVAGRAVLDVGTGSGVLAIVAHRLGAGPVVGIDNDPDAIESARENLALNDLATAIELKVGDFRSLHGIEAPIVTANLTGGLLVRGADTLAAAVAPHGHLIVSGVTTGEENDVRQAFALAFRLVERRGEEEWVGLLFERA